MIAGNMFPSPLTHMRWVSLIYWAMTALMAFVSWLWLHRRSQRHSKDPKTWPLLGAQREASKNFHRIHDWCLSYFKDDHRTVKLKVMTGCIYLTVDPLNVEHILKTNFQNYPKGERVHSRLYDFLGDGIFNADGDTWKKHRKIASVEFSNRKLKDFSTNAFREDALRLVQILHSAAASQQPVDLQDLLMRMTMDSICKVGFGVDMANLSPSLPDVPFGKAFDTVNEVITSRLMNPFWKVQKALNVGKERILKQEMATLNTFTSDIIRKRKAEMQAASVLGNNNCEARADLLSRFIGFNAGQAGAYSDEELRDSILNFIIAGRDTTAITLSWFIYCVCRHPHVGEKVFEESVEVLGLQQQKQYCFQEVAERLNYETLSKMHYLHAALTETLRLHPAVPRDGKTVLNDDVLPDGTHVKEGAQVSYVPYSMGRMEFLWGKDALNYNPDRWLKHGVFQSESPFKFSSFQAGPRICLGKDSAYLQMKMAASLLLYFLKFNMVHGHVVHYRVMMVMPMAHGLRVHVSHR